MTLLLLDGHNLLYRSFTSLPFAVIDGEGRPINGVYGMVSSIIRLARDLGANAAVAAFDVPEVPTFRHQRYPGYQAQRGPLGGEHAAEFARQVGIAQEVLPLIGVPALQAPGYEADDIMATLAGRLRRNTVIVSTDRDLLQLVRPGVAVMAPGNPPRWARNAADVQERLGVPPEQVTNWKALVGDASDNIPGLRGIGAKTATGLLERFGALEGIYEHLAELPTRQQQALAGQREEAFLFRDLVTVRQDVPLSLEDVPPLAVGPETGVREVLARAGYGRPS